VPARAGITVKNVRVTRNGASMLIDSGSSGTAHIFAWHDPSGDIPVYQTSCPVADDPPPDYGFTPCATSDGGIPAWSPDMSGHRLGDLNVAVHPGRQRVTMRLDSAARDQLRSGGRLLVSYLTDDADPNARRVEALDLKPR